MYSISVEERNREEEKKSTSQVRCKEMTLTQESRELNNYRSCVLRFALWWIRRVIRINSKQLNSHRKDFIGVLKQIQKKGDAESI